MACEYNSVNNQYCLTTTSNVLEHLNAFSLTENVDFNNGLFMQKLFASFEEREIFRASARSSLLIPVCAVEKKGCSPYTRTPFFFASGRERVCRLWDLKRCVLSMTVRPRE